MITKLEKALDKLKQHQDTGDYESLYVALNVIIQANKNEPENVDPLIRGLTTSVLEPLYLQVEKHLEEDRPKKEDDPCNVIFVDFARKKAA